MAPEGSRSGRSGDDLFRALLKAVLATAGIVVALWFLVRIKSVLLLLFLAVVLAAAMNAPVTWLEDRRINRTAAAIGTMLAVLALIGGLLWLIGPRVGEEVADLVIQLPQMAETLSERAASLLEGYPSLQERVRLNDDNLSQIGPWAGDVLGIAWGWATSLLALVAILIVLISLVLYMVINPRPLLTVYLRAWPEAHRAAATQAFTRSSRATSPSARRRGPRGLPAERAAVPRRT
jgi:predicted PurR-regulated permease PerM